MSNGNLVLTTWLAGLVFISLGNSCVTQTPPASGNIKAQPTGSPKPVIDTKPVTGSTIQPSPSNTPVKNIVAPTEVPIVSVPTEKPVPTATPTVISSPTATPTASPTESSTGSSGSSGGGGGGGTGATGDLTGSVQVNVNTAQPVQTTAP